MQNARIALFLLELHVRRRRQRHLVPQELHHAVVQKVYKIEDPLAECRESTQVPCIPQRARVCV